MLQLQQRALPSASVAQSSAPPLVLEPPSPEPPLVSSSAPQAAAIVAGAVANAPEVTKAVARVAKIANSIQGESETLALTPRGRRPYKKAAEVSSDESFASSSASSDDSEALSFSSDDEKELNPRRSRRKSISAPTSTPAPERRRFAVAQDSSSAEDTSHSDDYNNPRLDFAPAPGESIADVIPSDHSIPGDLSHMKLYLQQLAELLREEPSINAKTSLLDYLGNDAIITSRGRQGLSG